MAQDRQDRPGGTPPATAGTSTTPVRVPDHSGVGGTTEIADSVVARIAGLAAREVAGVHDLTPAGLTQSFGSIAGRVTGQDQLERMAAGAVDCRGAWRDRGWEHRPRALNPYPGRHLGRAA